MVVEKSCGAVVYKVINNERKYVIIANLEGIYGFPKGHIEPGESKKETALREIKEEVGVDVILDDNFETVVEHTFYKGKEERLKNVTYFLATYKGGELKAQETEISSVRLLDYKTAMGMFQFDNCRKVLKEAEDYLNQRS